MDTRAVVSVLGVWAGGKGSLHRKLTDALVEAVRQGGLPPGVRLPSERALARALAISRTTVVAAYDDLRERGWFESRHGSGTWVRSDSLAIAMARSAAQASAVTANPMLSLLVERGSDDVIDMGLGSPLALADLDADRFTLPKDEYDAVMRERCHYPLGAPGLRQAIADRYSQEGLSTTVEQVLVTNGAQHAVALSATLWLQRGDTGLIEDPGYFGAIAAFRTAGARLAPLPVRAGGVDPAVLRDRLPATAARLVYLTTGCQNPTGAVMSAASRKQIAKIVSDTGVPTIDDRTLADLVLGGSPAPPLAVHAPDAPILTVGSLAKLIGPSLRIGWIRAPEPLIQRLARLKAAIDLGSPLIAQAIAARLIRTTDEARRFRQRELKPRRDLLVSLLRAHLPEWTFSTPAGGLFLWVTLPNGDAREFAQVALRHGVVIVPGPTMSADEHHARCIRITFLWDAETLTAAVARLCTAWEFFQSIKPRSREHAVMV